MKISARWLREWVNPDITTDELLRRLTMAGLEVEGTAPAASPVTGVVVGKVLDVTPHPDADKLRVCKVSDGVAEFQVVCGAANVRAGLNVPFAKIGAELGPEFKIKKAKLRGVESNGMLCSATELGMAEESDGLLELPADAPVGADMRDWLQLDDTLVELNLTPNRGDCLSIAGLAREAGVLTRTAVTPPAIPKVADKVPDKFPVSLENAAACPRYLGRVIRNINPEVETPLWMQEKLRRGGLRCIDPVVDVTNYVLLELGQPMHAFDYNKLQGGIVVRNARAGEKLVLLDGKEVQLNADTLVIADQEQALAMAGVMGGKHSAVGPKTTDIFLESAFFAPLAIAGRARSYGMHTDAAHRYERGVDFNLAPVAMERATALLLDIVGGKPGPVVAATGDLPKTPPITLRRARIQSLLGMQLPDLEVLDILNRLGLQLAAQDAQGWTFAVPSWRFDITIEADLIEELARVHGYNQVPVNVPVTRLGLQPEPEAVTPLRRMRHALAARGYQEVVTYSFVAPELEEVLGAGKGKPVMLANAISQDMSAMRTSLWPGLVKTLVHNQNRQQLRARLFETGLVFSNNNKVIEQKVKVACLICGDQLPEQWGQPARAADFFDIKGEAELLVSLGAAPLSFSFRAAEHPALQKGQTAQIVRGEQAVGWVGAVQPKLSQALDITGKVLLLELDYAALKETQIPAVSELSRFPAVRRDLAIVIGQEVSAEAVQNVLRATAGPELQELQLFDLYQGGNIQKGKKSLALGLTFQHLSRTLTDADINPIIDSCIKALEAKFNAELR
jgi:phenylalanyl-tRNA synthetase beta chain